MARDAWLWNVSYFSLPSPFLSSSPLPLCYNKAPLRPGNKADGCSTECLALRTWECGNHLINMVTSEWVSPPTVAVTTLWPDNSWREEEKWWSLITALWTWLDQSYRMNYARTPNPAPDTDSTMERWWLQPATGRPLPQPTIPPLKILLKSSPDSSHYS